MLVISFNSVVCIECGIGKCHGYSGYREQTLEIRRETSMEMFWECLKGWLSIAVKVGLDVMNKLNDFLSS
jgi:hypothetical protein